ncbi:MAG TPA: papain-like cysteine protease family protein [Kofleriaceae bacterium]|nr:papain-like cysteine protease family protein [Kofleriaceae bacterium]
MARRALALLLGAAILATAAPPADAGGKPRSNRLVGRFKLRPTPGTRLKARRGGVLGAGWLHMAHAAAVAAPGAHAVGLPRAVVELRTAPGTWGRQRQSQWCWAAASQMVLNYLGLRVSQEDVITRAYGGYLDRPASPLEISITLDGWTPEGVLGLPRTVRASSWSGITSSDVVADLGAGRPMIVGLRNPDGQGGHAFVLTAMTYDVDAAGRIIGRTVTVRDPWPDSPSVQELSWDEVASRFVGAVRIDVL